MRFKGTATVLGAAALIAGLSAPASASATILNVADEASASSVINIQMTNLPSNFGSVVNIEQCWKNDTDPTFNAISHCDQSTADNQIIVGGNATKAYTVFNGPDLNLGENGCGPLYPGAPQCWIRLSGDPGTANDEFYPLVYGPVVVPPSTTLPPETTTTVVPAPEVPEAPMGVLLPLTAVALVGGSAFMVRRRRSASAS